MKIFLFGLSLEYICFLVTNVVTELSSSAELLLMALIFITFSWSKRGFYC